MMVMTRGVQRRLEDLCTLRNKYGAGIQRMGVNYAAYCIDLVFDVFAICYHRMNDVCLVIV